MKHFPAQRHHCAPEGLEHSRAPRNPAALVCALFYLGGFFTGAILFGEFLLTLHQ